MWRAGYINWEEEQFSVEKFKSHEEGEENKEKKKKKKLIESGVGLNNSKGTIKV